MTASVTPGRAPRYAGGSARGLLHHHPGHRPEARASIGRYLSFYNGTRPHSALGGRMPEQAYLNQLTPIPAAA